MVGEDKHWILRGAPEHQVLNLLERRVEVVDVAAALDASYDVEASPVFIIYQFFDRRNLA